MSDNNPYTPDRDRLKFVVMWAGRTKVKMGARMGGSFVSQEFERETALGDALDILRSRIVRKASGLEPPGDDEPQQTEIP